MKKILSLIIIINLFVFTNVHADAAYSKGIIKEDEAAYVYEDTNQSVKLKNDTGYVIRLNYPETFKILSEEGNYYKIYFQYSSFYHTGYIEKKYCSKTDYIVKNSTVDELKAKGFDDTYAYNLAVLKTIYPHWNFEIYNTGLDWNYTIERESSPIDVNLINGSNTTLRRTDSGAYNNGVWKLFDNGWYSASNQTIKYFMDPRNFFNEGHIFMFEKLSYDNSIDYSPAVQSVLSGTFMSGQGFSCKEGHDVCYNNTANQTAMSYVSIFTEAGRVNNVSPVHLATRVLLEQGVKGTVLSSGAGYNGQLAGYYNFFNYDAVGDGTNEIITNGLNYAKQKNWNSPFSSINGGASGLSNNYISAGQDTRYFQKFDVVAPASFHHQYQQSIKAPYVESYESYTTYYKNNLIEKGFTFSIPYFNNMPSYTSLSPESNEEVALKTLSISGCSIIPSFTPSASDYSCSVTKNITNVTVNAAPVNSLATVTGTGIQSLTNDITDIIVTVKAPAGNSKIYTVKIKKVDYADLSPDEIISRVGINNKSGIISGQNIMTTGESLATLIKNTIPSASVTVSNDTIGTGTTLTVSNGTTKVYTMLVYGDNDGDSFITILDLLKIQKHIIGASRLSGIFSSASDVNKDGKVDILDLLIIQKHILNVSLIKQ